MFTQRLRALPFAIAAVLVVATAVGLWAALPANASSRGRIGFSGNPASNDGELCSRCHTGGITPTVALDGPPMVAPGATLMLTLTVAGGQAALTGMNVSATGGSLAVPDGATDIQTIEGELTHTGPKAVGADDAATYAFLWQAPASDGSVTLYAAGNSVDGNGRPSGDAAAGTMLQITVGQGGVETPTATATGGISPTDTAEPATPTPNTPTLPPTAVPSQFEVVADDLPSPHGLAIPNDNELLVALGGTGEGPPGQFAPGNGDGSVLSIHLPSPAERTTLIEGMTNGIDPGGGIVGANHAVRADANGQSYAYVAQSGGPVQTRPEEAAKILRMGSDGEAEVFADPLAFEVANNPDGFPPNEDPVQSGVDSNPWRIVPGLADDGLYVVDAGANDILKMNAATGDLSLWALFAPLNVEGTQQPIPTGLAFDPDEPGVAYATLLGGFGPVGSGQLRRLEDMNADGDVLDDGENTLAGDGLWLPTDLAFSPDGYLYFAEIGGPGRIAYAWTEGDPIPFAEQTTSVAGRLQNGAPFGHTVVMGLPAVSALAFEPDGDLLATNTGHPNAPPMPNLRPDRIVRIPASRLGPPSGFATIYLPVAYKQHTISQ